MKRRQCCRCGCTDDNCAQCIERTGAPCHWVSNDLCSACNFKVEPGGEYVCRDKIVRVVTRVEGGNVRYHRFGSDHPYSMQLGRFQVNAIRRLDTEVRRAC